jgi:5-methyltetrahydrofolate--homocysteine methyltransferase
VVVEFAQSLGVHESLSESFTFTVAGGSVMGHVDTIYDGILKGNMKAVQDATSAGLSEGLSAGRLLNEAMIPAMAEVGRLFEANEYYVPEMLIAARAMKAGLAILRPQLVEEEVKPLGRVALGTVKGDLHDIGKNLVSIMIEGAGFEIIDLGVDVSPEAFVDAVRDQDVDLVGLSALLTTTMPSMKTTIEAFEEAGLRDQVKIIVGGAPVTQRYADEIGADGYGRDAAAAANLAKQLLGV